MKRLAHAALAVLLTSLMSTAALAYGAIAVDDEEGETEPGYGLVTGEPSQEAAKRKALRQCKEAGNDNCKVVVWFKNCGAYAASKKYYGYGYGTTKAVAVKQALEKCGNNSCRLVLAECE